MINTLNESSLHKTLKQLYSLNKGAVTEAPCDGHIYDILDKNGDVTEIQTQNLVKLLPKAQDAISRHRRCRIVYPLVIRKTIELYGETGARISKRKSPKTESIYSMFNELTGIYPVLLEKDFTLEVILINMTEIRKRTAEPVQSANNRRRFRRNWLKTDKRLDEIISSHVFSGAADYLELIPESCLPEFSAKTLAGALSADKTLPASAARQAHIMLWVLSRMNVIEQTCIRDRSRCYKIAEKYVNPHVYGNFKNISR